MGRYLVKIGELNDKNAYIENKINDIKNNVSNIINLKEDITWTGPAKDKFIIKYDEYIDYLNKMIVNLESCLKVNRRFQDNFTNGYREIKSNFKVLQNDVEAKWKM